MRLSDTHLVATSSGEYKFARDFSEQENLMVFDKSKGSLTEEKIMSIRSETVEGYTAPLTTSGNFLANGVLVSCYAMVDSHQKAHMSMKPVRVWCKMAKSLSEDLKIKDQKAGVHWYAASLYGLVRLRQNVRSHSHVSKIRKQPEMKNVVV